MSTSEIPVKQTYSTQSIRAVLTCAALSVAAALPATAATIVTNGSFETGVPGNAKGLNFGSKFGNLNTSGSSWDVWKRLNGWTTQTGPGIEVQSNRTLSTIDAQEGTKYVELDSNANSSMGQNIALKAGQYLLSFWYSPRTADPKTNGIEYAVGKLVSGTATNGQPVGARPGRWTLVSTLFTVKKAGSYLLAFGASGRNDSYGGLIDNISVDPAPVPLPAAGGLLLVGLGALVALRRKQKAA